jgi:hypothetical protein
MNSLLRLGVLAGLAALLLANPTAAQYIYMDTNGNAVHDSGDRLNSNGSSTCVDIYLNTAYNRDGSPGVCEQDPVGLDFSGYLFNLLAVTGTVTYSGFVNEQASFTIPLGVFNPDGIRYSNGFGSPAALAPGLYKISSMTIAGQTGTPKISIVPTILGVPFVTSFLTSCSGQDFDNTYKLGTSDWVDSDGLDAAGTSSTPTGINGRATGNCPSPDTPLLGVEVCARAVGTTSPVYTSTTNTNGEYSITVAPGDYDVWVIEPLGFALEPMVTEPVFCNDAATVDFLLECSPAAGERQKYSWWRYQFDMALGYVGGNSAGDCTNPGGRAAYCADTLCAYLDRVYAHFYGNTLNQIDVYGLDPSANTCNEKLHYVADEILKTGASESRQHRANRELMVLLLNVVSGRLRWSDIISADGRTASQAITYFDAVIASPPSTACGCYSWGAGVVGGGYGCAEHFAQQINGGTMMCSGVIPASTMNIAYRRGARDIQFRALPNAGSRAWTFSFRLAEAGRVRLSLFDLAGRHIVTLHNQLLPAGAHTIAWNGLGAHNAPLARAVYFAQLKTPTGEVAVKVPVTVR